MSKNLSKSSCSSCHSCSCSNKFNLKWLLSALLAALIFTFLLALIFPSTISAQENQVNKDNVDNLNKQSLTNDFSNNDNQNCITKKQVQDSINNSQCLVIFENKVYDFTKEAKLWDLDGHVGQHFCGQEYDSPAINAGPHKIDVVDKFFLNDLCESDSSNQSKDQSINPPINESNYSNQTTTSKSALSQFFTLPFGSTWRRLSSWLALVFFVLNFTTCYAMPWAKMPAPWEGDRPGKDKHDKIGHFPFTKWHAHFAWLAVFFLSLHGILAFLCVLFGKCF